MLIRIDLICQDGHIQRDVQHDNKDLEYGLCPYFDVYATQDCELECLAVTEQYYGERRSGEGNWVMRGKGDDGKIYDD